MRIQSAHLSSHTVVHHCLINCTFCSFLCCVENLWDSFNPSSLSLIAVETREAPFSTPLERQFVWCGFDVGLKWIQRTDTHMRAHTLKNTHRRTCKKRASECTDKCAWGKKLMKKDKYILISPAVWGEKKGQIGRCAFSLTPCIHLPLLPLCRPTQYTYTPALKSSSCRRIHLTHFISFVLSFRALFIILVMSLMWLGAFSFLRKEGKKITAVDNCQVLCTSHHKKKKKKPPNHNKCSQAFHTALKRRAGKTSYFHLTSLLFFISCSAAAYMNLIVKFITHAPVSVAAQPSPPPCFCGSH